MDYLVRIDPIIYNNILVTKDTFIHTDVLNKDIFGELNVCYEDCKCPKECVRNCCRHKTEPKNGFWLSVLTKNNLSNGWSDYLDFTINRYKNIEGYEKFIDTWSNIRIIKYKVNPSIKLYFVDKPEDIIKYLITVPAKKLLDEEFIQNNNINILKEFLKIHKITFDESVVGDSSKKGVTVSYDDKDNITIIKGKSGSKLQILASVNYLIIEATKKLDQIRIKIKKNITVDYDTIRKDGYDGIQFGNLEYKDEYTKDEYLDSIQYFLSRWEPHTAVVWNYCFDDYYEVSYIHSN